MLGVDPGTVRIGLAVCDPDRLVATPLATVKAGKGAVAEIARHVADLGCVAVVVGLPRSLQGRETGSTTMARDLASALEGAGLVVHLQDERLTSVQADRAFRAQGKSTRQSKDHKDQVAASLLLQAWIDGQATNGTAAQRDQRAP